MTIRNFPPHLHKKLGFYVYVYRDPRNGKVFYVGKGKGNRAFSHLEDGSKSRKAKRIRDIRSERQEPIIEILVHGVDEGTALRVEASVIDLLGPKELVNEVRGHLSSEHGIMSLSQVIGKYEASRARIVDPVILVRINQLFRYGMTDQELYDATRGVWVLAPAKRKQPPKYALAVYQGVVQEVYEIFNWFKAGRTLSTRADLNIRDEWWDDPGKVEFVGTFAASRIRRRYKFHDVSQYFERNTQSPIIYVNC